MLLSKSVVDDIAFLAPFEVPLARLWRSYGAVMAQLWRSYGAVMAQLWRSLSNCAILGG
jgi:hypothetical protein